MPNGAIQTKEQFLHVLNMAVSRAVSLPQFALGDGRSLFARNTLPVKVRIAALREDDRLHQKIQVRRGDISRGEDPRQSFVRVRPEFFTYSTNNQVASIVHGAVHVTQNFSGGGYGNEVMVDQPLYPFTTGVIQDLQETIARENELQGNSVEPLSGAEGIPGSSFQEESTRVQVNADGTTEVVPATKFTMHADAREDRRLGRSFGSTSRTAEPVAASSLTPFFAGPYALDPESDVRNLKAFIHDYTSGLVKHFGDSITVGSDVSRTSLLIELAKAKRKELANTQDAVGLDDYQLLELQTTDAQIEVLQQRLNSLESQIGGLTEELPPRSPDQGTGSTPTDNEA